MKTENNGFKVENQIVHVEGGAAGFIPDIVL